MTVSPNYGYFWGPPKNKHALILYWGPLVYGKYHLNDYRGFDGIFHVWVDWLHLNHKGGSAKKSLDCSLSLYSGGAIHIENEINLSKILGYPACATSGL